MDKKHCKWNTKGSKYNADHRRRYSFTITGECSGSCDLKAHEKLGYTQNPQIVNSKWKHFFLCNKYPEYRSRTEN